VLTTIDLCGGGFDVISPIMGDYTTVTSSRINGIPATSIDMS
jgi:hypothetical protein